VPSAAFRFHSLVAPCRELSCWSCNSRGYQGPRGSACYSLPNGFVRKPAGKLLVQIFSSSPPPPSAIRLRRFCLQARSPVVFSIRSGNHPRRFTEGVPRHPFRYPLPWRPPFFVGTPAKRASFDVHGRLRRCPMPGDPARTPIWGNALQAFSCVRSFRPCFNVLLVGEASPLPLSAFSPLRRLSHRTCNFWRRLDLREMSLCSPAFLPPQ